MTAEPKARTPLIDDVAVDPTASPSVRDRLTSVIRYDLPASLVVFLVAVPLSIGIAVASSAPIMAGLTVVVAELIGRFGWSITCFITITAGLVQILLGLSRIARQALAISPVVVHAMLAGIGVTIALQQIHVLLGEESKSSALENITSLPASLRSADMASVLVGIIVIAIMLLWPRVPGVTGKIPGPLVAVVAATGFSLAAGMNITRIELPGSLIEAISLPTIPDGKWAAVATGILTIALVASVESLLSAVAVDKVHSGERTNFDRELLGQGAANMASGLAGGLPVTGVIVRSATNARSGARSRLSAIMHGVWILAFSVLLINVVELVPYAALAGLLVMIGVQLVKLANIRLARKTGDATIYAVTVVCVVLLNLLEGVLIGLALSLVLVLRRMLWARVNAEQLAGGGESSSRVL